MTYEFTDDCLIHIDEIDNEHRKLFQMVNEAISLTKNTTDVAPIANNLIANLKDYAATHFAHEEAYMESINDPELPMQRTEHAAFAKKSMILYWIQLPKRQHAPIPPSWNVWLKLISPNWMKWITISRNI